jgi:threonine dehydrogenase-like Zn-dependent dehydrogenase
MEAAAAVLIEPEKMLIRSFPYPQVGPEDMVLRVERVSICGSDVKLYTGARKNPSYPIILGHEVVGSVQQIGHMAANTYGANIGDRVVVEPYLSCNHCVYCVSGSYQLCIHLRCYGINMSCSTPPHLFGAYSEYMFVAAGSRVHKVPEHVPANAACMASVIANGIRWVHTKGNLKPGGTIAIFGPGAQGIASVIAACQGGAAEIIIVGLKKDSERLKFAQQFGATKALVWEENDPVQEILALTGDGVDLAIECSGVPIALSKALESLRPQGTLVMAGVNEGTPSTIPHDRVVRKELQIFGGLGQVYGEVKRAIELMAKDKFPIAKMVQKVFPLKQAENAMRFFIDHPEQSMRVAISPNEIKI